MVDPVEEDGSAFESPATRAWFLCCLPCVISSRHFLQVSTILLLLAALKEGPAFSNQFWHLPHSCSKTPLTVLVGRRAFEAPFGGIFPLLHVPIQLWYVDAVKLDCSRDEPWPFGVDATKVLTKKDSFCQLTPPETSQSTNQR
jgi:hypothetical protein